MKEVRYNNEMYYNRMKGSDIVFVDRLLNDRFKECKSDEELCENKARSIAFLLYRNAEQYVTKHGWEHSSSRYMRRESTKDKSFFFTKEMMTTAIKTCIMSNAEVIIEFLKTDYSRLNIVWKLPIEIGVRYPKGKELKNPVYSKKVIVVIAKDCYQPDKLNIVTAYPI